MDSPMHLPQVQEAVRRSLWEIYEAREKRPVAPEQGAAYLVPTPLAPWIGPETTDVLPNGDPHPLARS